MSQKALESIEKLDEQVRQIQQDSSMVGQPWPGRKLTSSVFGSDAASDVGSLTGSIAESVSSFALGWATDERGLLPQTGRTRLAARQAARARRRDKNAYL